MREGVTHGFFPLTETSGGSDPTVREIRNLSHVKLLTRISTRNYESKVAKALIAVFSDSSINQYQSAWKIFHNWLLADSISIIQAHILSYLVRNSGSKDGARFYAKNAYF